ESIYPARITAKHLGLFSRTYSDYSGATDHITIYDELALTSSIVLSSGEQGKVDHPHAAFAVVDDRLLIAGKEKGLGIFDIQKSHFKESDEFGNRASNSRVSLSKINYERVENEEVIKITIVPSTTTIILTLREANGKMRHEIRDIPQSAR